MQRVAIRISARTARAVPQLVIRTGHRLSGKQVLIPTKKVDRISYEESTVFVNLTEEGVKQSPAPHLVPHSANFTLARTELEPLQDQEVLVRNLFMPVDPYMRGRMNDGKSYVPPFELGKPLDGGAVGEVIESRAKEFKPSDAVTSNFGWREYFIASPKALRPASREVQPLSVYLGALGMTGMTAWVGLNLVEVKAGDVILISGAAGAVGSVAGQLAKLRGCRVIGSAGSMEKVMFLREECGFDIAFDYKVNPVTGLSGLDVSFYLNGMFIFLLTMIRTGPNNPEAGKGSKPTGPRKLAV